MGRPTRNSKWFAATAENRTRKIAGFTLSDEARERLKTLVTSWRSKSASALVERLIMSAPLTPPDEEG